MLQSCTLSNIRLNLAHPRVSPLFCMSTKHVEFYIPNWIPTAGGTLLAGRTRLPKGGARYDLPRVET